MRDLITIKWVTKNDWKIYQSPSTFCIATITAVSSKNPKPRPMEPI